MYNPLQFFSPMNARIDQAGQIASQIAETNRLRDARAKQQDARAKQQAGAQKFIDLQGLMNSGALEGDEDALNIARQGMQDASLSALGDSEKFMNYQLKQQQMQARQQKANALSDPRVQELMGIQKNASLKAKGLVSKYLNTDSLEGKQAIEQEYLTLSKISNDAGAELGSNPSLSGYHHTKMPNLYRMIEGAVKGRGSQNLASIEKETKEAQRDKIIIESQDTKGRLARFNAMQSEKLDQLKEKRGFEKHNQITTVLSDMKLAEPSVYEGVIKDAQFAKGQENVFTMVKLLSNVIEPGLSVTEGEVSGYIIGGQGVVAKLLQNTVGSSPQNLDEIMRLLTGIATRRKKEAQSVIARGGKRPDNTEYADEEYEW